MNDPMNAPQAHITELTAWLAAHPKQPAPSSTRTARRRCSAGKTRPGSSSPGPRRSSSRAREAHGEPRTLYPLPRPGRAPGRGLRGLHGADCGHRGR